MKKSRPLKLLLCCLSVIASMLAMLACAPGPNGGDNNGDKPASVLPAKTTFDTAPLETTRAAAEPINISFAAVGDNLIHSSIYNYYSTGGGNYDFNPAYAHVKSYIEAADFAFINQETICGGTELGLSDYPRFNGPHQVLDAVAATGFDWLNTASNHSFDVEEAGILSQLDYLSGLPGLVETGTHAQPADAATSRIVELGGLKLGLASYSYGLNGLALPDGKEYLIDLIDIQRIEQDMTALVAASDIQLVNMHWGDEYSHEPNQEQIQLAQMLSDLGVDVVIGEHPHVVQPTTMITGSSGNETLVIYSLGNFLSAQDEVPRMLGEMAAWTLVFDPGTNKVSVQEVKIWPTVTQINPGWAAHRVYTLHDYTDALAAEHMLAPALSRQALIDLSNQVFGNRFPVIY